MKIKINKTNRTLKDLFNDGVVIDIPNRDNALKTKIGICDACGKKKVALYPDVAELLNWVCGSCNTPKNNPTAQLSEQWKSDQREFRRVRRITMDIELCDIEIKKLQDKKKKLIDLKYKHSR